MKKNFEGRRGRNKGKGGGEEGRGGEDRTGFEDVIPGTHSSRQQQRSRLGKL